MYVVVICQLTMTTPTLDDNVLLSLSFLCVIYRKQKQRTALPSIGLEHNRLLRSFR